MKAQRPPQREILATFYRDEEMNLRLHELSVSEPRVGHNGQSYRSLDHYDVDWCKRDEVYLFHLSGSGGKWPQEVRGIYWRTKGFQVKERAALWCDGDGDGIDHAKTKYVRARNRTHRLISVPREARDQWVTFHDGKRCRMTSTDLLDWLENNGRQEDAVFCGECGDYLPGDDLCAHCWWCDSQGWYVTPGGEFTACLDTDCWGCTRVRRRRHEQYWKEKRLARWRAAS